MHSNDLFNTVYRIWKEQTGKLTTFREKRDWFHCATIQNGMEFQGPYFKDSKMRKVMVPIVGFMNNLLRLADP